MSLPPRIESKIQRGESCWQWIASLNESGYGQLYVKVDGRNAMRKAHRVVYELLVGPIPHGKQLDHLCRNRACVNPAHLEPVTNHVNALRGERAIKTHCKRGHPLSGSNLISKLSRYGHPARECRTCHYELARLRYARRKQVVA